MRDLLKRVVGTVAPTLGTAIGGPFGGLALKFLADRFTDGDTGRVEDYLAAASADPDTLKELRLADIEFRKYLQEVGIKEYELEVRDRESARDLAKARGLWVRGALSGVFIIGYFAILALFFGGEAFTVPDAMQDAFLIMIGVLTAAVPQILAFWFGSSRGSKDKDEALATAASRR